MMSPESGGTRPDRQAVLRLALTELKDLRSRVATLETAAREPIAIVGMACRFPGGASDPSAYWELLRQGGDAVGEVPPERWASLPRREPDATGPGLATTRYGGFLD